jgi:Glyoxalase-like domain
MGRKGKLAVNAAIDHVFICSSVGAAAEADALVRLGLHEGSPNTHPGQGTACRRFFFENAYLELFWVADPREAQADEVLPTSLFERWSKRHDGGCPFAIIFRPGDEAGAVSPPFPSWSYRPSYMPAGVAIEVARGTPLAGPEFFYLGFQRGRPRQGQERVDHALPIRKLVGVTVWRPPNGDSAAAQALQAAGLLAFRDAEDYRIELRFEAPSHGQADARPALPLTLVW